MSHEMTVGHFAVVLLETGDRYGVGGAFGAEQPLVEFYDTRYHFQPITPTSTVAAQFTGARYYLSTLLERPLNFGLMLNGGVPEWTLSVAEMNEVMDWLVEVATMRPA